MAGERLQRVADAFEAWSRDDFGAAATLFSEDVEWHPHLAALDQDLYRGRSEIEAMFREVSERLDLEMDFSRMEPLGDCVLVDVQARGEGKGAGAEWFQLYSFSGDEICRVQAFEQRDAAVGAAGVT